MVANRVAGEEQLAGDIGACAYGIFREGSRWIGRSVGCRGSPQRRGDGGGLDRRAQRGGPLRRGHPRGVQRFRVPGADELANMFQFNAEFAGEYRATRDLATSRVLNPNLTRYRRWLEQNAASRTLG